jgi:hypothetical protein
MQQVWARIEGCQGQPFTQIRGAQFTYRVDGNLVFPDHTVQAIHRSQFEKALELVPLSGPGEIQHLRGPSYIYAVLMDPRIRKGEW